VPSLTSRLEVVFLVRDSYSAKSELKDWNFLVIKRNTRSIEVIVPPMYDSKSAILVVYLSLTVVVYGPLKNCNLTIKPSYSAYLGSE
jgi:hypothetical protein